MLRGPGPGWSAPPPRPPFGAEYRYGIEVGDIALDYDRRAPISRAPHTNRAAAVVVLVVGGVSAYFALRNKIDLSINISVGSAAQIALFVAPVLVLASFGVGPFPMALVFNGFEIGAIFLAVFIAQEVTQRGDTTWFEGLQLLAVYAVLALTFFFV